MWQRLLVNAMIGIVVFPASLSAIPADDLQQIQISSNSFQYDNEKGVATYVGNVIAKQGSRQLNGDKLEVIRNKKGDIAQIIVYGKPAKHQSLTDPNKPLMHAKANTIIYDTVAQYLTLVDNAWLEQAGDEYAAPKIEYDATKHLVKSQANAQGRTTITLQPRP